MLEFISECFTSKSRRAWLLCLLLLGNANFGVGVATKTVHVSFTQTSDPKQEGKDNDEGKNKSQEKSGQADQDPKASNKTTNKKINKDQPQTEPTEDGALSSAGVVAGKGVLPNPIGRTSSGDGRYFVGEVSVNDGSSILIGGTRVEGDLRWLSVLRAGMWAEAYGHWENDVFVADDVVVREDNDWAYYRGPAAALGADAQGTVEAWTTEGKEAFESVRTAPDDGSAVRLVAYYDGQSFIAVPQTLPPPLTGGAPGWLELKGYFDGEKVVWESAVPFP